MIKNEDADYIIYSGLCMLCSYGILIAIIISYNYLKIERFTHGDRSKRIWKLYFLKNWKIEDHSELWSRMNKLCCYGSAYIVIRASI